MRSRYGGSVRSPARTVEQPSWYDGLGTLVGTEKSRNGGFPSREDFKVDGAGNVQERLEIAATGERAIERHHYADEKLRVYSRVGTRTFRATRVAFEECRYDALGRRVLLRSRGDSAITTKEVEKGTIARFVWDGDRLLHEVRMPGGHDKSAAALESDIAAGAPHFGRAGYVHAPDGLDHPLAVDARGGIIPHADWRGSYDAGTRTSNGSEAPSDLDWPGTEFSAYRWPDVWEDTRGWAGSLLLGQRDESGQLYMRNRYYEPKTGRFTQEDPIGLAGGLNNYSDPFGTCPVLAALLGPVAAVATGVWCAAETALVGFAAWRAAKNVMEARSSTSGESKAASKGRKEHKEWNPGAGFEKEFTLPSGKRCDAYNPETCEIKELKPNNERAKRRGEKQVKEYKEELERETGKRHKTKVETYDP